MSRIWSLILETLIRWCHTWCHPFLTVFSVPGHFGSMRTVAGRLYLPKSMWQLVSHMIELIRLRRMEEVSPQLDLNCLMILPPLWMPRGCLIWKLLEPSGFSLVQCVLFIFCWRCFPLFCWSWELSSWLWEHSYLLAYLLIICPTVGL